MDGEVLPGQLLEQYSLQHPQEVLLVTAQVAGEPEQVMVFKGFSSSLMRATAYDPDVPLLPGGAEIVSIDRLRGPYRPDAPEYLQRGLSWAEFERLLSGAS